MMTLPMRITGSSGISSTVFGAFSTLDAESGAVSTRVLLGVCGAVGVEDATNDDVFVQDSGIRAEVIQRKGADPQRREVTQDVGQEQTRFRLVFQPNAVELKVKRSCQWVELLGVEL